MPGQCGPNVLKALWELGPLSVRKIRRIGSILEARDPFQHRGRRTGSLLIAAVAVLVVVAEAGFRLQAQDEPKLQPEQ